jgi:S-adenosylmethionine synthetase
MVAVMGEITTSKALDYDTIVRGVVKQIGFNSYVDDLSSVDSKGLDFKTCEVMVRINKQSPDIAGGVHVGKDEMDVGAGDQGIMFGYACTETPTLMPAPLYYSHEILRSLAKARHADSNSGLGPDSKSQVTLQYENGKPVGATSVVVSTQHADGLDQDQIREIVRPHVESLLPAGWMCPEEEFYVNPTGRFVIGGPDGDCGLTGRKIIVDTYGGAAPHGGGAFSGKDPTKVDRSAAYAARWVAKNVVAAGMAEKCVIQLAYAIGVAKPLSVYVDTAGTATMDEDKLAGVIQEVVDLSPRGIREGLQLSRPIYARSAAYGHFGREPDADGGFSWEKTDLVDALKAAASS